MHRIPDRSTFITGVLRAFFRLSGQFRTEAGTRLTHGRGKPFFHPGKMSDGFPEPDLWRPAGRVAKLLEA